MLSDDGPDRRPPTRVSAAPAERSPTHHAAADPSRPSSTIRSAPRWPALALFGLAVAMMALGVLLALFATGEPFTADLVLFPIAYLAFAGVGALVLVRQPRNVIGGGGGGARRRAGEVGGG